jgi:dihydroorotase-like cyclic amidohydrolase
MEGEVVPTHSALFSQHVVLPYELEPVSALVLLRDEFIVAVVRVSSEELEQVMQQYREYQLLNYSHLYISPGLVDINVCFNAPTAALERPRSDDTVTDGWEGYHFGTLTAAAGGVTTVVECPTMLEQDMNSFESINAKRAFLEETSLYCDLGLLALVTPDNIDKIQAMSDAGVLGFKSFVVPPGSNHSYFDFTLLAEAMRRVCELDKTLIVHPIDTTEQKIHKLSPFRNSLNTDRLTESTPEYSDCFSSAYSESVTDSLDSASSEEDLEESIISMKRLNSYIDDQMLGKAISRLIKSKDYLVSAEAQTYQKSGRTIFRSRTAVVKTSSASSFGSLRGNIRPMTIMCKQPSNSHEHYAGFLANYPFDWERRGAAVMLSQIELVVGGRLHLTKVSSAVTVHFINMTKQEKPHLRVTFDVGAHYTFFSAEDIRDGDTRFKTLPPIRDLENRLILNEFLRRGDIDAVCSGHRLAKPSLKSIERGSFKRSISGVSCNGLTLQATWMALGANDDKQLPKLALALSQRPAEIVGLSHIKGSIEAGKHGDLVVWAPYESFRVNEESVPMKHPSLNVFYGHLMQGRIHAVYCRGSLSFAPSRLKAVGKLI